MVKFSIITICKNNFIGLKATYESVICQTYKAYEWLVVDTDSVDGTKEWLRELSFPGEFTWRSGPHKNLFESMNEGLAMASGDYLIFLNSADCLFESGTLYKVVEKIKYLPELPDFIYGDSVDVTPEGKQYYSVARSYRTIWRGQFAQHQAMFFRREAIGDLKYRLELSLNADYAFIYEFLKKITCLSHPRILRLEFPVCTFLLGGLNFRFRSKILYKDFYIRRKIMQLPLFGCVLLFLLHYGHFILKKIAPGLTHWLRYRQISFGGGKKSY
jgi:putative colanic acid biosynthesis glycosyltransferase